MKAHNDYSAMHVSAMVELCSVVCVERLMLLGGAYLSSKFVTNYADYANCLWGCGILSLGMGRLWWDLL